jgi:hypothetical protein
VSSAVFSVSPLRAHVAEVARVAASAVYSARRRLLTYIRCV